MPVPTAKTLGSRITSFGVEAGHIDQQAEGPLRGWRPRALDRLGLALLVERHHHRGSAVAPDQPSLVQERRLALLERQRVDHALALQAAGVPPRSRSMLRVDHHRHPRDRRLGGDEVEEGGHRPFSVEQRLVEVDVEELGTGLDLLAGDLERGLVLLLAGSVARSGATRSRWSARRRSRSCVSGAITNGSSPASRVRGSSVGTPTWRHAVHRLGDRRDMIRRGAATAADDVHESFARPRRRGRRPSSRRSRS